MNGQHYIYSKWYINEDRDTPLQTGISYAVCRSLVAQSEPTFDELMIYACAMPTILQH